ncbi:copper amine oxidase N-terminal domain-containing protein [Aneurinibacillus sp. REN35]|uniref:copper amine oxidase N-terminal domain-containing protein n=1 Tax=Aneurinibacillus sp. REN35 TaxID=3237286 RepID=UPI003527394C
MNKKIVSGLLAATLLMGGTSVLAQDAKPAAEKSKEPEQAVKATGLENALNHVKSETARQAIKANIEKQAASTADTINVTPPTDKQDKTEVSKEAMITVKINGKLILADQKPVNINGRVVVPLRSIFEALGADIKWDDAKKIVHAAKGNKKIKVKIGDQIAEINGKKVQLDQKAILLHDRSMVPVRFVSEALGANVEWDAKNMTVHIKTVK